MIKRKTIEDLILKTHGIFNSKDIFKHNQIIFRGYSYAKSLAYITTIFHYLWKSTKLKKVSHGLFTADLSYQEVNFNDFTNVINYYCKDGNGFVGKEFLWLKHGLATNYPQKLTIYTNLVFHKVIKNNVAIIPSKILITNDNIDLLEFFELIYLTKLNNFEHIAILNKFYQQKNLNFKVISQYKNLFARRFKKYLKLKDQLI